MYIVSLLNQIKRNFSIEEIFPTESECCVIRIVICTTAQCHRVGRCALVPSAQEGPAGVWTRAGRQPCQTASPGGGGGNKREARSEKRIQIRSVRLRFSDLAAVQIRLCKVFGEASWFLRVLTPVLFFSCQTSPPALPQTLVEPGKHGPLVPGPMLTLTPPSADCAPQYQPSKPLTARPAIRR